MRVGPCVEDDTVYTFVIQLVETFDECPLAVGLEVGDMQAIAVGRA